MVKISRDEYRSLELKIETEIKKIFSQFIEELESRSAEGREPAPAQAPGHSSGTPSSANPLPHGPKKHRGAKRSIVISEILGRPSPAGKNRPGSVLESDMDKIFRKKHKRNTR